MNKTVRIKLVLAGLLLIPLSSAVFTSCDDSHPELDITMEADYSDVIAAIKDADKSLSDKMALIQAAVGSGMAETDSIVDMIMDALSAMDASLDEKIAAIKAAMTAQTTSLETKLALAEASVKGGYADALTQQELLNQAVAAMSGSFEEKLAAVETALQDRGTSLDTKLGLVEALVQQGFADAATAQELIQKALESVGTTQEEKIKAIEDALESQAVVLSAKITLIQAAIDNGFAADSEKEALIQAALNSLSGSVQDKIDALVAVVNSQAVTLEAKMDLLDEALDITGATQLMELIRQALVSLEGTTEEKLDAINAALASQTTGLETKLGLIATALQQGFSDEKDALDAFKTAIETSLGNLDQALSAVKDDILTQLAASSSELSTTELAAALADIVSAIDSKNQTSEQQLASIQASLASLMEELKPSVILSFAAPVPDRTVTAGESFEIVLRVEPEDATLVKDSLKVEYVSRKTFFKAGAPSSSEEDVFIQSIEADPVTKGQYLVTLASNPTSSVWEETSLALVYHMGYAGHPKLFTLDPFQVTVMPRPAKALESAYYPNAAFQMRDTFIVHENKVILDVMGAIYYPLGKVDFKSEKTNETRTYTADNISSVSFAPLDPDTAASVFTILDKEKHFVSFSPDTTGNKAWRNFKWKFANDHEYQEVTGNLALTDKWGATDCVPLSMKFFVAWTINYEIVMEKEGLKPSDFEYNGKTYVHEDSQLWPLLSLWGLDYYTIKNAGFVLEYANKGCGDKHKHVRLKLPPDSPSAYFEVASGVQPVKGDQFQSLGVLRLRVHPSDVDPSFQPTQILYKYQINLPVDNDDTP